MDNPAVSISPVHARERAGIRWFLTIAPIANCNMISKACHGLATWRRVSHSGFAKHPVLHACIAAALAVLLAKPRQGRPHLLILIMRTERPISPEIAQGIADMYALADEIEAGRVKRPAKTFLDLAYKVAGMIFLSDPVGACSRAEQAKPKRLPPLARIAKHGLEVRVAPDGSFVIARGKSDVEVTSPEQTPEDELERWRKKKYAR